MHTVSKNPCRCIRKLALEKRCHSSRLRSQDFEKSHLHQILDSIWRIGSQKTSFVNESNPIASLGFIQISSRNKDCDFLSEQLIQDSPKIPAGYRVYAAGGFIQKKNFRSMD